LDQQKGDLTARLSALLTGKDVVFDLVIEKVDHSELMWDQLLADLSEAVMAIVTAM